MNSTTHCELETLRIGGALARLLFPGAFIALWGSLGAGKTAFVRGVGSALGIEDISSPTFTVAHIHAGEMPLYHIDAYRLSSPQELYDIGFEDYLRVGGAILMEWPGNVREALPEERLDVTITGNGSDPRYITFKAHGAQHTELLNKLRSWLIGGDEHVDTLA